MHITSLPGNYGIGTIGKEAFAFVDFLKQTGQSYWQVLPLTPTEVGNSPYQSPGVFAGNPNLIYLEDLRDRGLLEDSDLCEIVISDDEETVNYQSIMEWKPKILKKAFSRFQIDSDYNNFQAERNYKMITVCLSVQTGGSHCPR